MTEEALLTLSRIQREADLRLAPLDHIAVGGDLADAGGDIASLGNFVIAGIITDHMFREAKAAHARVGRLLREIEEKRT